MYIKNIYHIYIYYAFLLHVLPTARWNKHQWRATPLVHNTVEPSRQLPGGSRTPGGQFLDKGLCKFSIPFWLYGLMAVENSGTIKGKTRGASFRQSYPSRTQEQDGGQPDDTFLPGNWVITRN